MVPLVALFVLAAPASPPGLVVTWQRAGGDSAPATLTLSLRGEQLRLESTAPGAPVLLWDGAKKQLLLFTVAQRTYSRIDEATARLLADRRLGRDDPSRKAIEQSTAHLSAERQRQVRAELDRMANVPQPDTGPTKFTSTREQDSVGTWRCERYTTQRGATAREQCLVPWKRAPLQAAELRALAPLASFLELVRGPPPDDDVLQPVPDGAPGLAARVVTVRNGRPTTLTLVSVARVQVDAASFALPEGLAEKVP